MKRLTRLLPALSLALLFCVCAPGAHAKQRWLSVRSQNFTLVGDAGEQELRRVGTRLEQFRAILLRLFPTADVRASVPTNVIVFQSDEEFRPFKPLYQGKPQAHVTGYFQPGEELNYIALAAPQGSLNPFRVIFHEYTHLLVNSNLPDPPVWFNEGLAEYYSTFTADGDRRFTTGWPINGHVLLLRRQFIPLEELLNVAYDSPIYNEGDKSSIFYAESWVLMHYLLQGDKRERIAQLARFNELRASGQPLAESFRQAFQLDIKTLEGQLRAYIANDIYASTTYTAPQPILFNAELRTRQLSEAEAQSYLGDLLYHSNRLTEAEAHLGQALARAPELALAHATLGMVRVRERRYAEAVKELRQAVAADTQNYLVHYYLAEALSRQSLGPDNVIVRYPAAVAADMRAALQQAIKLNPNCAEAYHLLGFLNMVNEEDLPAATVLLQRARQLRPERLQYAITLAQIYMRRAEFDAARNVLEQVLHSPNLDAHRRADAQAARTSVDDYAAQLARIKADNANPPRMTPHETSSQATEEEPAPDAFKLRIPRRVPGPQVRGLLTNIECAGGQSVVFHVQAGDRLYKFHADEFRRVRLIAYVPGWAGTSITCGPVNKELYAVLTYRPATLKPTRYDGEALAVDLITKDMEVEP
ncbi:MAG: peptidase MA family metallohydrolase [Pyrinomonadaceae bacterium]